MANISMTDIPLICHPASDAGGVDGVTVSITCGPNGEINIVYRLSGVIDLLEIPALGARDRVDGLWKNTCFECFIKRSDSESYLEYNFAPSGQWAAYQFASYRKGMSNAETYPTEITTEQMDDTLVVSVSLRLPNAWQDTDLLAGISAVLVAKSGQISYWALRHPPGKPDFHHKDCFALQLEARSAA